jgi:hypothetical protein
MYRGSSRATILALRSTCGSSLYPFHRSAWKVNSANFAQTEFYEVRLRRHPKEVALPAEVGVQEVVETLVVGREEPL